MRTFGRTVCGDCVLLRRDHVFFPNVLVSKRSWFWAMLNAFAAVFKPSPRCAWDQTDRAIADKCFKLLADSPNPTISVS
jgi:hypothetical protein